MNEQQWLACQSSARMLEYLRGSGRASERKLRLFAVACCRQPSFFGRWSTVDSAAVALAERYAEGQADLHQLQAARQQALYMGPTWCCADRAEGAANSWIQYFDRYRSSTSADHALLVALLREIFGNPFRPVAIEPGWLRWNGGLVPRLAQAATEQRQLPAGYLDAAPLAVLADAAEEAGCTDAGLLGHLRGPGPHVRGCWALDYLRVPQPA